MGTELKTDSWHRYMLYRRDDRYMALEPEEKRREAAEKGKQFTLAAYPDVWAKDTRLVERVRQFLGANFHWHDRLAKSGSDLDVVQTLHNMVRGGSVAVIPEEPVRGGIAWPPKTAASTSFWGVSDYGETSPVAVKGRYQAQLERMNAERSIWAETVAMMDGINAGFMAKMAGISPTLDAMFQAAGWTEKYPDAGGGALSLLGDARPFEYAEGALSGDAMDLAGNLTPNMGTAGSWFTNPGSGQMRMYGQGGFPVVDFDFDHDHGQGIPHAHNWEDNGGPFPIRGPGVRFSPLP